MQILKSNIEKQELPFKIHISFEKIYDYLEVQATDSESIFNASAIQILKEVNQYPILKTGFEDFDLLHTHESQIQKLLQVLFPDLLQSNEIKAISIPFRLTSFFLSKRFKEIIKNAGEDYIFTMRNFEENNLYILSCLYILSFYYDIHIDYKRPFFFDIPNTKNNSTYSYRVLFNADFSSVIKTDRAPEITPEDIKALMNNFENIDVWKEKFPPESYIFKGFGIINLFDVTQDETISSIKNTFIKRDIESFQDLEEHIRKLYNIENLKLGISIFNKTTEGINNYTNFNDFSLIAPNFCPYPEKHFCIGIINSVFNSSKITSITDLDSYGKKQPNNFYKAAVHNQIKSIILVPVELDNNFLAILEVASPKAYQLNAINANKLKDIIPALAITIERSIDERQNLLESIIQEHYTTIHPSVKWKFHEAADAYIANSTTNKLTKLKDIKFKNVYPLYGQCDVKNSSVVRNTAIQEDFTYQLKQSILLFQEILLENNLIAYQQIIYRLKQTLSSIKETIKTTDELRITQLFKQDIYPILEYIKTTNSNLKEKITLYFEEIDPVLNIVYKKRKAYEDFVTHLNTRFAKHLDKAQLEVQQFYPHYYERFKTDGIDYNMYIGESITNTKKFHPIYIQNLRLWQLQQQCELEYIAKNIDQEHREISLQVTSLILVHSLPLDIQFRMDEKKFDVDGAYNIRYEIIKKRIDKSHLKNTTERLTQVGKIAIVYTHEHDLQEYLKYIDYLKKLDYFKDEIEFLDIEDLQGVSGLKAIRVSVNFEKQNNEKLSFEKLLKITQLMN